MWIRTYLPHDFFLFSLVFNKLWYLPVRNFILGSLFQFGQSVFFPLFKYTLFLVKGPNYYIFRLGLTANKKIILLRLGNKMVQRVTLLIIINNVSISSRLNKVNINIQLLIIMVKIIIEHLRVFVLQILLQYFLVFFTYLLLVILLRFFI